MQVAQTDPDFVILLSASVVIILLFITTILSLVFLSQKRYLKHLREKEKLQETYSQEILKAHIEVQEQTFSMISEEIHDNIGQSLSLVRLNLSMGQPKQLEQAKDILTTSIQELRSIARSLNSAALKSRGLVSFICEEISRLEQTQAYQVDVELDYDDEDAVYDNQILLVRIFQEAINNIIKHSSATILEISVTIQNENLILRIKDNGSGFDKDAVAGGIGLSNMQKRAILAGGRLDIISKIGEGCLLILEAELNKPNFDGFEDYDSSISRRS